MSVMRARKVVGKLSRVKFLSEKVPKKKMTASISNSSCLSVSLPTLSGHSASYHRAEAAAAAATTVLNARKKKKNSFTATSTRRSQRTSTRTTSATYSSQQRIGSGREPCLPLIGGHAIPMVKAQVMSSREEYALDIRHGAKVDLCKC